MPVEKYSDTFDKMYMMFPRESSSLLIRIIYLKARNERDSVAIALISTSEVCERTKVWFL